MRELHPHDDPEEIVSMKMTPPLRIALAAGPDGPAIAAPTDAGQRH
ncbi:hypothetical protein AB0C50_18665 [Micromonospora taraxaci]|nr:hypothetical protein [Micromonospora taraxaci]